eukprot:4744081-Alexandrium_andersonii.AAC.1
MADCGFRRTAALTGLGRIADCTLGTLQCKDASMTVHGIGHRCSMGAAAMAHHCDGACDVAS